MHANRKGWIILLLSGSVWGITFTLAKIMTKAGAHPIGMNLWQATIGAGVLALLLFIKGRKPPVDRHHLVFYFVCSLTGTVIPGTLLFYCSFYLPAGVLSITTATVPILTVVAALLFKIESFLFKRILGVLLGAASIILMAVPETSLPEPGSQIWVLLAVLASLLYCIENIYITLRKPADTDALTILFGMQAVAAIILLPLVLLTDSAVPVYWIWDWRGLVLVCMAFINVFAYGSFIYLITYSGPVFASQMAYVITLAGVFWGMLVLGEMHSTWIWLSLVMMLAGLYLVQPRNS